MSIMMLKVTSKSLKDHLVNTKDWLKGVDSQCYACECGYLEKLLKCKRSHAGKHVCVVAYATEMRQVVPPGSGFESVCLPEHDELRMGMKKGLNKLARRLGIEVNHTELVNDFTDCGRISSLLMDYKERKCYGGERDLKERQWFALSINVIRM